MNTRHISLLVALLSLVASVAVAAPKRTHTVTASDYFSLAHVYQVAPSPKGDRVVYAELRWQRGHEARNVDLWVVDRKAKRQRLTFDRAMDHHPVWSPDGRWIYFLSRGRRGLPKALAKTQQVWRMRSDASGLMAVTRHAKGVESYALSHDGQSLVYTTAKKRTRGDKLTGLKKKFAKLQYGSGVYKYTHLWRLDLREWRTRRITKVADRFVRSFALSQDGSKLIAVTVPSRRLIDNEGWSKIEILELKKGTWSALPDALWRKKAPSPYGWLSDPGFCPDGSIASFRVSFDGYPSETVVVPLTGEKRHQARLLPRSWRDAEVTLSGAAHWNPKLRGDERSICVKAIWRARHGVYCWHEVTAQAQEPLRSTTRATSGNVSNYGMSRDGKTLVLSMSDLTHPP
ncbi:MAG TPA: hypothetical protein DCQ06_11730, partial [Myxococcales bacterium]|nr:hypothetical protein [Myxococcales bacterium]